jgi:hypothetical protein
MLAWLLIFLVLALMGCAGVPRAASSSPAPASLPPTPPGMSTKMQLGQPTVKQSVVAPKVVDTNAPTITGLACYGMLTVTNIEGTNTVLQDLPDTNKVLFEWRKP